MSGPPLARRVGRARFPGSLRLRLTAVYGGLFLIAGTALLAITYGLVARQIGARAARLPRVDELRVPAPALRRLLGAGRGETLRAIRDAQQGERANALHELMTQSAIALAFMTLIAVVLGWVLAGRALRPLREITATARRLSTHNLDERINLEGSGGELKDLADTFDGMLARLSAAFEAQRRFAANASHELRTPLTVQRAAIDVALANPTEASLRTMALRLRAATERHEHVIESLLTLARSQSGVDRCESVDLAAAAGAALAGAAAEVRGRELRVERGLEPAVLFGDPVLIERLAVNLVQNATRHNLDGGWLGVTTRDDGHRVTLRVVNSGRELPRETVAELFRPFGRMDQDRVASGRSGPGREPVAGRPGERAAPGPAEADRVPPGSAGAAGGAPSVAAAPAGAGLGLSIVAAIAAAHGGTCTARARAGGGLEVSVSLPTGGGPRHPGHLLPHRQSGAGHRERPVPPVPAVPPSPPVPPART
ncbi:two-component sensor histidine kinase [Streptomyces sulfonofaciens]|uniref:histidine kinase n=1 Tax=Streptomyces sulfonofaciens TaxID=68272 RepID=A0A919G4C3_9ACTN|nr:ATP-binding protein [Streptomyces sulfonofaciens]GHH77444.1 two-component sensor histidine kinase [Streptomyces sulfonofaciens]